MLILSFLIPLTDLSFVPLDYHVLPASLLEHPGFIPVGSHPETAVTMDARIGFSLLPFVYWCGFLFMVARFLFSIGRIMQLRRRAGAQRHGEVNVFLIESAQPFSFFNMIFLPKRNIDPMIFEHERAHVHNHHWVDLMIVEAACSFLWFNPVMNFYRRSVKTQHEFEADAYSIRKNGSIEAYLKCIIKHLQNEHSSAPISQFFDLNIKQRIIMMTKDKTPNRFSFLYLLLVPVVFALLVAFSNRFPSPDAFSVATDNAAAVIIIDAGHGGHDAGKQVSDGIDEKDLTLAVAQQILKAADKRNVKVILTRTDDHALSLADRVKVTNRYKADLFISLHANFDDQNAAMSGAELVVSEKNARFAESKLWSDKLIHRLNEIEGLKINGIKTSDPYVLSNNSIPAVIMELGYLSNKQDNAYLTDQKNQEMIAQKIIAAVTDSTK